MNYDGTEENDPQIDHYFGRFSFNNSINPSDFSDSDFYTTRAARWVEVTNASDTIPYSKYVAGGGHI